RWETIHAAPIVRNTNETPAKAKPTTYQSCSNRTPFGTVQEAAGRGVFARAPRTLILSAGHGPTESPDGRSGPPDRAGRGCRPARQETPLERGLRAGAGLGGPALGIAGCPRIDRGGAPIRIGRASTGGDVIRHRRHRCGERDAPSARAGSRRAPRRDAVVRRPCAA